MAATHLPHGQEECVIVAAFPQIFHKPRFLALDAMSAASQYHSKERIIYIMLPSMEGRVRSLYKREYLSGNMFGPRSKPLAGTWFT